MNNWLHLIKGYCVNCKEEIPGSKENYEQRGNWCSTCNAVCEYRGKRSYTGKLELLKMERDDKIKKRVF